VKERRGPLGRTVGAVAQGLAGAARRRQTERQPRVVIYDEAGHSTLLEPGADGHDELVSAAERIIESTRTEPPAGADEPA
jgi:hypothetical protein